MVILLKIIFAGIPHTQFKKKKKFYFQFPQIFDFLQNNHSIKILIHTSRTHLTLLLHYNLHILICIIIIITSKNPLCHTNGVQFYFLMKF